MSDDAKKAKVEAEAVRSKLLEREAEVAAVTRRLEAVGEASARANALERRVEGLVMSLREAEGRQGAQDAKDRTVSEELTRLREEVKAGKGRAEAAAEVEGLTKQRNTLQSQLEAARRDAALLRQERSAERDTREGGGHGGEEGGGQGFASLADEETERLRQRVAELEAAAAIMAIVVPPPASSDTTRDLQRRLKETEDSLEKHKDGRERTKDEVTVLSAAFFDLGQRHLQALTQRYVEAEGNTYSNVPLQSRRRQLEKTFLPLSKK